MPAAVVLAWPCRSSELGLAVHVACMAELAADGALGNIGGSLPPLVNLTSICHRYFYCERPCGQKLMSKKAHPPFFKFRC